MVTWRVATAAVPKERREIMTSPHRAGGENPTRSLLVNSTEQIMLEDGYAAVTYRNVAAKAGVSLGAVQHHFPSLDDLFLAVVRQYSERNLDMMVSALEATPGDVLQVLWECSSDDISSALFIELMALVNHRKSIQAEVTEFAHQYRKVQLDALTANWASLDLPTEDLTPEAVVFLLTCVPRWMRFEGSFGLSEGGADVKRLVQRYLDLAKPAPDGQDHPQSAPGEKSPGPTGRSGVPAPEPPALLGAASRQAFKRAASSAKSAAHYTRMGLRALTVRRDDDGSTHDQ